MSSFARGTLLFIALAALGCSSAGASDPVPPCDLPDISDANCAAAKALLLPDALPPSRGNQYGDNEAAATLGFYLFFDSTLGTGVGCANCHAPELAFTDRLPVSKGKTMGTRNSPTVFNSARLNVIFWDGRADSLWSQPLFAIENAAEMASTRLELAHFVQQNAIHRASYEAVFGSLPDMSTWPAAGKPGDAAYDDLPDAQKDQINRVAANVGKAFDAYMRKNTTGPAALDSFLKGDTSNLIPAARRGLNAFIENKCDSCHSGPALSDESFHDAGFPSLPGALPDLGRAEGVDVLEANIFNLAGPYADPGPGIPAAPPQPGQVGAFRTPPLRNITRTGPYGHDGALASLRDVLNLHGPSLSTKDAGDVLAFFEALNGAYPPKPWNNWPSPQ